MPSSLVKPIRGAVELRHERASGRKLAVRLRGPSGVKDEFLLAATAQNLRKLAKLIIPTMPQRCEPAPKVDPSYCLT